MNSSPLGYVSESNPADRSSRERARRTDSSSSTTAISGGRWGTDATLPVLRSGEALDLGLRPFGQPSRPRRQAPRPTAQGRKNPTVFDLLGAPRADAVGEAHELGKGRGFHLHHDARAVNFDRLLGDP